MDIPRSRPAIRMEHAKQRQPFYQDSNRERAIVYRVYIGVTTHALTIQISQNATDLLARNLSTRGFRERRSASRGNMSYSLPSSGSQWIESTMDNNAMMRIYTSYAEAKFIRYGDLRQIPW
jgi:hypothetical protein